MTIRLKVLLVLGLTLGLVLLMGMMHARSVHSSRAARDRLIVTQEQIDSFGRLHVVADQYLRALLRARNAGGDTRSLLGQMNSRIHQEEILLKRFALQEEHEGSNQERPTELAELEESLQALRHWASQVEETVRNLPAEEQLIATEWRLAAEFEKDVGGVITQAQQEEYKERARQQETMEAQLRDAERSALLVAVALCALLLLLAIIVLVPMGRALKELMAAARRIGQGDFAVQLPMERRDELGELSRAFTQMAGEMRDILQEKQRLMKAEAEANEREFRRYNALLEETVQARTAQLEQANAQLSESLQQLKATQEQLIFAGRLASVGQLAAGVGHEINNPLSYVLSNLNFLQKELTRLRPAFPESSFEEIAEVVSEAREGAERVRTIVKDLKMLARPEEGSIGAVDLGEVVSKAIKMVSREFYHRARVVEDCDKVPPVRGNAQRLGQVFLNLFINAAHAIAPGKEEENEVRVMARMSGIDRVAVEVRDTGAGIPSELLSSIFDPFFTTKPAGQGSGLGLWVCHSIIVSCGGELRVASEVGRGTTFHILLPVADSAPNTESVAGS
jgi:two-component system, NtrC family, sensor kinase